MSAHAGRTHETPPSPGQQVTPVIIKTGGDDSDPGQVQVTINLKNKTFEGNNEHQWRSAQSTVAAGIMSVEIKDGDKHTRHATDNPRLEGAKLQIIFGTEMLVLENVALQEPHRTSVVITSPNAFEVTKQGTQADQWIESRSSFPAAKPLVIFSQGGHVFITHQCETDIVELTLEVEWDETGG